MSSSVFSMIGTPEILVIAVVVLILFGAKKVPELMKGVGSGIKEFKKASRDVQDELHRAMDEVERTPPPSPPPPPKPTADSLVQSSKSDDATKV